MNELINILKSGFWHILNPTSTIHLVFVLLLLITIDLKKWQRTTTLILLFSIGFYISLLLDVYHIISANKNFINLVVLSSILIISIFNYLTFNKNLKSFKNILAFIFGIIHGLTPLGTLGIKIKNSSLKFISSLFADLGILSGFITFVLFNILIITILQFFSKVTRSNVCNVINGLGIIYGIYLLLNYFGMIHW